MCTADALEKITKDKPEYLRNHQSAILKRCHTAMNIELKWHLALLATRLPLTKEELKTVWQILTGWATNRKKSKIVRVNALQGLFNLMAQHQELKADFCQTASRLKNENVPSLNASIRKLKKATEPHS
jgi:hypothetical protein